MLYLDYERYLANYRETQNKYDEILAEKERLFQQTQPRSMDYSKDRVQTSPSNDSFDNYLIRKEETQVEERLAEVKGLLEDRERLLYYKLQELKHSNVVEDRIYLYRMIERWRVKRIAKRMGYSESQVYRILHSIAETCEKMREKPC